MNKSYRIVQIIEGIVQTSLEHREEWRINHPPRKPSPAFDHSHNKEFFVISNLNLPLCRFVPFPCTSCWLQVRRDWHLLFYFPSCGSCREERGHSCLPLHHTVQLKCSQPLLIEHAFHSFYHYYCPPTDVFKYYSIVFTLCSPELLTVFQVGLASVLNMRVISFDHLFMLCLIHSKIPFSLLAARAQCWLLLSLLLSRIIRSLSTDLLSS